MPDYDVVVGNYEGERVLPDCLASVTMQTPPPRHVIVVDASSRDSSREIASALGATVIQVANRGLGVLYNRGVEAAASEHVLLLNNDVALEPGCAANLVAELERDPTRFAADPTQRDWTGERVIHAWTTVERGGVRGEHIPGLHLDPVAAAADVVPTVCANGAAMLVRRQMILGLGGFDESYFMEWEDLDICWRAWIRGWSTVYVPAAEVRHRVGAVTSAEVAPRRRASSHHNMIRFALKCLPTEDAARVVLGELARVPAHPRAIGNAAARIAIEFGAIARLRAGERRVAPLLGVTAMRRLASPRVADPA